MARNSRNDDPEPRSVRSARGPVRPSPLVDPFPGSTVRNAEDTIMNMRTASERHRSSPPGSSSGRVLRAIHIDGHAREKAAGPETPSPHHTGRSPRHRQGSLHLRLPPGGQLPHPVFVLRGPRRPRVQGALERDPQRRPGLHARRQGGPDAELRHAVLPARRRLADRTAGPHRAGRRVGPLLLAAIHRPLHVQLRLRRQPRHRQRRRQLPARRAELAGREARGHQGGDPLRDGVRVRALSHAALQARRHRQRQEGPGGVQGPDALRLPRTSPPRPPRRGRFPQAAHPRAATILARILQRPGFRAAVLPHPSFRGGTEGAFRQARHRDGQAFDATKLSPEIRKAVEEGMADAWREFAEFKKTQLDTGKSTSADGFGTRRVHEGPLHRSHGRRGARDLRKLEGGGDLPGVLRGLRRREARRIQEPLHAPLRAGPAAAGQRVLVAHDVRASRRASSSRTR